MRLHWRGKGRRGEHVRDVKRRGDVGWIATRGYFSAGAHPKLDGSWLWRASLLNHLAAPQSFGGRTDRFCDLVLHRDGVVDTRRKAQRAARKSLDRIRGSSRNDHCKHYGFDFRAASREERRTGVVQKCCACGMIIHAVAAGL